MAVRVGKKKWKCSRCGKQITANNPPQVCPICDGLNSYYRPKEV